MDLNDLLLTDEDMRNVVRGLDNAVLYDTAIARAQLVKAVRGIMLRIQAYDAEALEEALDTFNPTVPSAHLAPPSPPERTDE